MTLTPEHLPEEQRKILREVALTYRRARFRIAGIRAQRLSACAITYPPKRRGRLRRPSGG